MDMTTQLFSKSVSVHMCSTFSFQLMIFGISLLSRLFPKGYKICHDLYHCLTSNVTSNCTFLNCFTFVTPFLSLPFLLSEILFPSHSGSAECSGVWDTLRGGAHSLWTIERCWVNRMLLDYSCHSTSESNLGHRENVKLYFVHRKL